MFRIGELARMAGVSVRTLRHYDHINLFTPHTLSDSGQRLYAPDALARLQRIIALKNLGFSLEEIAQVMNGEQFTALLERKRVELQAQHAQVAHRLKAVEAALAKEQRMNQYQIELKTLPAYPVLAARGHAQDFRHVAAPMNALFDRVYQTLKARGQQPSTNNAVLWHGDYRSEDGLVLEVGVGFDGIPSSDAPLPDDVYQTEFPGVQVAATVHRGSYERFGEAYGALLTWMAEHQFVPDGPVREVYVHCDADETEHVSELQIPVRRA